MFTIRIVYLDNEVKFLDNLTAEDLFDFLDRFSYMIGLTIKRITINFLGGSK